MRAQAPADARVQQLESNLEEEGNAGAELRCGHGATHHPWGPLGQWQTSRECHRFLRWGRGGPLGESWVAFFALRIETSLQGLWRRGTRLLAGWGFGTRTVGKAAPVASGFESWGAASWLEA